MINTNFDNGSTSFPKPHEVAEAVGEHILNVGGSYGRGSHARSFAMAGLEEDARDLMGQFIGEMDGENIAWAKNATEAANIILHSLDLRGKKVMVSPLEHNCTMRPLTYMGAELIVMPHLGDGRIDVEALRREYDGTVALCVVNHESNVNGVIQPLEAVREVVKCPLMVDTCQSLGHVPFITAVCDYAIFTAHKGLLGVQGLGGLYARDTTTLRPLIYGGTGSNSDSYMMPSVFPEFIEAGTHNGVGVVGLAAALKHRPKPQHTHSELLDMIEEIKSIPDIEVFCALDGSYQGELFSFRHKTIDGSFITHRLGEEYGISCRFGLHCAPLAHSTLGTTQSGLIRVAPSIYHTAKDLSYFTTALKTVLRS